MARGARTLALATLVAGAWANTHAQGVATGLQKTDATLRSAFDAAWARQPEAQALAARRDAARAQAQAARSWTPEPVAMELSTQTDRLSRKLGTRETALGVAIPLWLPGERGRSQRLADAEQRAVESHAAAARLRLAATVRDAWWALQRALVDLEALRGQREHVRRIAADVGRRLQAGDLARADQHQAEGALALADAAVAQAQGALTLAQQHLHTLTARPDLVPTQGVAATAEPEPPAAPTPMAGSDTHAELLAWQDRAALAEASLALAATRSRANPELTVATTHDRGADGAPGQQSLTVGLRLPFGAGAQHAARLASARADLVALQAQMALESARLAGARSSAQARTDTARAQLDAAERRARLARESRGFFDKSFRLGETDLPTRLRIEAEAADAERQAAHARIELAAAVSAWRQALGLLPQ